MGRLARIGIAILLILTILVAPVIKLELNEKTYEVPYGPVALASATLLMKSIVRESYSNLTSLLYDFLKEDYEPLELNMMTLLIITFLGLLFVTPIGAVLALFSRAGFALSLIGSLFMLLLLMTKNIVPEYGIFLIMILSILGLALGGPGRTQQRS
ncbi:hypothetical protein PNA2_1446 [Pyrococcus sp. NA2]|uniref:hypothetical protein n=1 Tax=Pyrococcus sp. (strain NA2) TaxID=342949 RepID=UPI000209AF85|nr:hypothetical protein [Pyrococcus sp. NA2]AEC52361.1 hypothetical protein PNA2_1446 [Pyrococcus sp. NA2]